MMLVLCIGVVTLCKSQQKDYVTISGSISNTKVSSIEIFNWDGYKKEIKVDKDNDFLDTLKIEVGDYYIAYGKKRDAIYLKNGFDLDVSINETVVYSGEGSDINNYLNKNSLISNDLVLELTNDSITEAVFNDKTKSLITLQLNLLEKANIKDTVFVKNQIKNLKSSLEYQKSKYQRKLFFKKLKGKKSFIFSNYENNKGEPASLANLKGKYVYIDIWATWCKPCIAEFPHLEKLQEEYQGKNIEFVSISVDSEVNKSKWKTMIDKNKLKGIQLFADNSFDSNFIKFYKITGIPHFILLDNEGLVIAGNAPRPSYKKELGLLLKELEL